MTTMCLLVCAMSPWMFSNVFPNKASKTPTTKNSTFVMAASKQFLVDFILKSPHLGEDNDLHGALLEVGMDKFSTVASFNCMNFVVGLKWVGCHGLYNDA